MAKEKAFFGASKAEVARFKREVEKDTGIKSKPAKKKSRKRKRKG